MAYDFHYTPTGTGVISGKEVLEQTEDAINDLGNTAISGVQEALDKAEQALTNSENAVDDAQTALNTANNAEGVAIQAQTDVSNLSGTVTNIGNRVTTAEGNITNLQGRMTTAEGNITNLQGRMTTAETNIGNLQTAVSTAQATANSAQQTATTARQQSYVFRYSGTAVVPNSTIAYSTIDNTDNIKSGDKVFDVDGKIFTVVSVDTANQTVTVGSALIDLALDSNVVHTSGNETVGGAKTFSENLTIFNSDSSQSTKNLVIGSSKIQVGDTSNQDTFGINFNAGASYVAQVTAFKDASATQNLQLNVRTRDGSNNLITSMARLRLFSSGNSSFEAGVNDLTSLGSSSYKWKDVNTYLMNGLTPSSLSMPDIANKIDISSYITDLTGGNNNFIAPSNGYIFVRTTNGTYLKLVEYPSGVVSSVCSQTADDIGTFIPVLADRTCIIVIKCSSIDRAYFIPCLGNV